jgi:hypothetical protein
LDPYALYELCVTEPERVVRFIEAVHGGTPRVLREDFSGTGALARAWAACSERRSAIAVDSDPAPLARLQGTPRVRIVRARAESCRRKADVIAATNFPLGYFHDRAALVRYLRRVRASLSRGGVFVADMYGGADAFTPMTLKRTRRGPGGERVEYTWEQRHADALSGLVLNTLSFRVWPARRSARAHPTSPRPSPRVRVFPDAFVYHWRLWSIPELRDAVRDAGFATFDVYDELADAVDDDGRVYVSPVREGELERNWVVYLIAR